MLTKEMLTIIASLDSKTKAFFPAVDWVKITQDETNTLRFWRYDTDVYRHAETCSTGQRGAIVVSFSRLKKAVQALKNSATIIFTIADDNKLYLTGDKCLVFDLESIADITDFPEWPKFESKSRSIEAIDLLERLDYLAPFMSDDSTRQNLTCVHFAHDKLAATNGHYIGLVPWLSKHESFTIDRSIVLNMQACKKTKTKIHEIAIDKNEPGAFLFTFSTEHTTMQWSTMREPLDSPDFRRIIPEIDEKRRVSVDAEDLITALRAAKDINRLNDVKRDAETLVHLRFLGSTFEVYTYNESKVEAWVQDQEQTKPKMMCIDSVYLLDALSGLGRVYIVPPMSVCDPVTIYGHKKFEQTAYVMPVRT